MHSTAGPVRIGVIGCGYRMSGLLARMVAIDPRINVAAITDPKAERIEWARKELNPDIRVCADYQSLVADPSIQWVCIGSLNSQHATHAIAAMEAGKDVFCEKPIATTIDDCVAIRDAVQRTGRTFAVGFTLRYNKMERVIKQQLESGVIGRPISVEFNEVLGFNHGGMIHGNWRRFTRLAGSHLLEKCCHDIDCINWFLDAKATRVASFGGCNFFTPANADQIDRVGPGPNGERPFAQANHSETNPFLAEKDIVDNQVVILEYDTGVRASFHINCSAAIPERRIYICGTEGTLRGDRITGRLEVQRIGWDEPMTVWPDLRGLGGHGGADDTLCREVLQMIFDGAPPKATVADGLRAAVTCFAADQAMEEGRVVDLTPYWQRVAPARRREPVQPALTV